MSSPITWPEAFAIVGTTTAICGLVAFALWVLLRSSTRVTEISSEDVDKILADPEAFVRRVREMKEDGSTVRTEQ